MRPLNLERRRELTAGRLLMGRVERYRINLLRVYSIVWSAATITSLTEPKGNDKEHIKVASMDAAAADDTASNVDSVHLKRLSELQEKTMSIRSASC